MRKFLAACSLVALLCCCSLSRANLHDPSNSADYLIISTAQLITGNSWISDLAQWRAQHGRDVMVVAADSIWNEFGNGAPSDTVLKEFLFYARNHWQAPRLADVFIIGFHDVVPSHITLDSISVNVPPNIRWDRCDFLSDLYYTTDPDSQNYLPLFNIGRLPWSPTYQEPLWNYYQKIVAYESSAQADWKKTVHLIADVQDNSFNFARDFSEPIAGEIHSGYDIVRDYLDYPVGNEWHGDRESIFSHLCAGSYLAVYNGHGIYGVWSPELLLNEVFFDSLNNFPRMPIVMAVPRDMLTNQGFDLGTIARSFISNPNGGAIAYLAWASLSWAFSGNEFMQYVARYATSDTVRVLGDIVRETEIDYITRFQVLPRYGVSPSRTTALGHMLLGDPGLRLPQRPYAVKELAKSQPSNFKITGNYPNPFNASTNIAFELNRHERVSLKIMDILGREVTTLLDESRPSGQYSVLWNAAGLGSGVYFAVLQSQGEQQVKKMLMIK